MEAELRTALVEEACKKSSVLWLTYEGSERARPAWHVWSDGAAYVVGAASAESDEQQLPGLEKTTKATVTCRSKDTEARLVTWTAEVEHLENGSPDWDEAFKALRSERLNSIDVKSLRERWLKQVFVVRIKPTQDFSEFPGAYSTDEGAAPPPDTPASTRGKLPWVLHRRARKVRRLF